MGQPALEEGALWMPAPAASACLPACLPAFLGTAGGTAGAPSHLMPQGCGGQAEQAPAPPPQRCPQLQPCGISLLSGQEGLTIAEQPLVKKDAGIP